MRNEKEKGVEGLCENISTFRALETLLYKGKGRGKVRIQYRGKEERVRNKEKFHRSDNMWGPLTNESVGG